ncbi:MAG: KAP family P-loop NTPase fold protein [Bacillota bacterium]
MISNKVIKELNSWIFRILSVLLFFLLLEFVRGNFSILTDNLAAFNIRPFILYILLYIVFISIAINFFLFILSDRYNTYTTITLLFFISICVSYLFGKSHLKAYKGDRLSDFFDTSFYVSVGLIFIFILVRVVLYIVARFNKWKSEKEEAAKTFTVSSESAISSMKDDDFGRVKFTKDISELISERSSESLTVGIYGRWGSGKSSVLNLVRENLQEKKANTIVVNFTPWYFESESNDLIIRFFEQLLEALNKERGINSNLKKDLYDYIKLFAAISIRPPGLIINFKEIVSNEEKDLYKLKKDLETKFKYISKKIVVFIDELDRLDNDEIKVIFKLIRLIGDFPNITYLIGMDEDKVSKSLGSSLSNGSKEVDDYELGKEYLEKFIQVPLYLPRIEKNSLEKFINNKISITFTEEQLKEIDTPFIIEQLISQNFSVRNMVRYFNLVSFFSKILEDEVNLNDLSLLLMIKIKNMKLFQFISSHPNYFTEKVDTKILEKDKELEEMKETLNQYKSILLQLSNYSAQLFNGKPEALTIQGKNRLMDKENFIKYFQYNVPEGVLSVAEIKLFLNQLVTSDLTLVEEEFKKLKDSYSIENIYKLIEENINQIEENKRGLFELYKLTLGEYKKDLSDTERRGVINLISICLEKNYDEEYLKELLKADKIPIAYGIKSRIRNSLILSEYEKNDFKTRVESYFDSYINRTLLTNPEISDQDKHMIFREWLWEESSKDIEMLRQRVRALLQTPSDLNQLIGYFLFVLTDDVFSDDLKVLQYYARTVEIIDWEQLNKLMYEEGSTEHYRNIQYVKRLENQSDLFILRTLKDISIQRGRKVIEKDIDSRYYPAYEMIGKRGKPEIIKDIQKYIDFSDKS